MGVTVVEKGLRCFDRSPWSIITQRRDSGRDWKLRRVSAALPLKSTATCFRDLSPMPPQTLQGLEVAGQRAAVLALRDGYQGRRTYRRVGSAPRERREEELAGARRAIGLHANAVHEECHTCQVKCDTPWAGATCPYSTPVFTVKTGRWHPNPRPPPPSPHSRLPQCDRTFRAGIPTSRYPLEVATAQFSMEAVCVRVAQMDLASWPIKLLPI
jgi:hypothetical protein